MDSFKIKLILEVFRTMVTIDNDQWERERCYCKGGTTLCPGAIAPKVFLYILLIFFIVYLVKI